MWGHQRCLDANCFYQPSECERFSCFTGVAAARRFACRPDILNPDPIWRPQHFNSQETCFFYNFFCECSDAKREEKHTHALNTFAHLKTLHILQASQVITFTKMKTARALVITFIWIEGNWGAVTAWNDWKYKHRPARFYFQTLSGRPLAHSSAVCMFSWWQITLLLIG